MRHIKWLCLVFSVVLNIAHAGVTPKMYTLKKDNQTIHLFGSIHVGKAEFFPLPDYVMANFDTADAVAFEIDMSDTLSMAVGLASKQMKSMFTDDKRLNDYVNKLDIKKLQDITGKPVNLSLKPAEYFLDLASLIISQTSLSVNYGIDLSLEQRAMAKKKQMIGLETMAEQIGIFYDLPIDTQADLLHYTLADWENQSGMLEKLSEMWAKGDEKLLDFSIEELEKQNIDDAFVERLLYKRNQGMAASLVKHQKKGINTIFCTIGAMHIYGKRSVTDYLQQAGYKVTAEFPTK